MKIEEFRIDGMPAGYGVLDVDLTPSGVPVATIYNPAAEEPQPAVIVHGRIIPLPKEVLWMYKGKPSLFAFVRCIGEDRLVVARMRAKGEEDINAWIISVEGQVEDSFHAGDDIEELLASEDCIIGFYGDEGQTNGVSRRISYEAAAFFDSSGRFLWGHASHFPPKERLFIWFHAACWAAPDEVAVFADVDSNRMKCGYVRLDVEAKRQTTSPPPSEIEMPVAIAVAGDRILAYCDGGITSWDPVSNTLTRLADYPGEYPTERPMLRGLPGGRFIAPAPDGYRIISFAD